MKVKTLPILALALLTGGVTASLAQPYPGPPNSDPDGYYSQSDPNGYYDRNGQYHQTQGYPDNNGPGPGNGYGPPPPPPGDYGPPPGPPPDAYVEGGYEQNCRRGNAAAGTIFGALAGGLIGGAASHGNGGAVVGGAVLGGLLGNAVSQDVDCDDQPYAFRIYADGLNGEIGRRYEWRHGAAYGDFTPTREFRRDGLVCREFTETSYRGGRGRTRTGTACRARDGNWHFD